MNQQYIMYLQFLKSDVSGSMISKLTKWFFVHIQRICYSFGSRLLEVKSKSEEEWIDLHILLLGEIEFILTLYIQFVYAFRHIIFMRISKKVNIHVKFIYRSTCKCKKKSTYTFLLQGIISKQYNLQQTLYLYVIKMFYPF